MVDGVEVEALFQDRFQRFQEVVFTFPDLAAAQADEMMMEMAFIVAVIQFIAAAAVVEIEFLQEVHLGEQVQRPVDRSQADVRRRLLDQLEDFFGAHMADRAFDEGPQDDLPLGRHLAFLELDLFFHAFHHGIHDFFLISFCSRCFHCTSSPFLYMYCKTINVYTKSVRLPSPGR